MATYYLDYEGGNDANNGTTFANRWKTLAGGAASLAPGDTVRVMGSPAPVSLGTNLTLTFQSNDATLAAAKTTHIADCESIWTGTTNVTTGLSTDNKQGTYSANIAVDAAHTGGKAAYYTMPSTLDLSAYRKISFWFKVNVPVLGSKIIIKLCSDSNGDTALHTFTITADRSFPNNWMPFTFLASLTPEASEYLSNNVNSIAVYTDGGIGNVQINLDNILACNDLTLTCLLGHDSSATSFIWYPIRYIDGTSIRLESNRTASADATSQTWHESTATKTGYVRETIRMEATETSAGFLGASDNLITYSGGWDRTDMSTQTGLTFVMPDRGNSYIHSLPAAYWYITKLCVVYNGTGQYTVKGKVVSCGFYAGDYMQAPSYTMISTCYFIANTYRGLYAATNTTSIYDCKFYSNTVGIDCVYPSSVGAHICLWQKISIKNSSECAIYVNQDVLIESIDISDCYYGLYTILSGGIEVVDATINNCLYGLYTYFGLIKAHNVSITNVKSGGAAVYGNVRATNLNGNGMVHYANSSTTHKWIEKVTSPVHGTSTISIKHQPKLDQNFEWVPISQQSQPFAVKANSLVTCKVWARRTNTTVQGGIRIAACYTKGIASDIYTAITAAADTWQELTVTFTPTENTVGIIHFESYNNSPITSGNVYFGDVTVTQA